MWGVVVCSRCGNARGVDLRAKTATCACGFAILVRSVRVLARTDDARDLPELVGETNARLQGAPEVARPRRRRARDPIARAAERARRAGDRRHRIRAAAVELTRELEAFDAADWHRVLHALGIDGADASLEELVHGNVIYEPRPGYYRAVDVGP